MIKYRLKFSYHKENIVADRENNINEILSDIDTIVSDTPIRKPLDGEIILVSGQEYKVESVSISFEKEEDITYYDFIVLLKRNIKYKPTKELSEEELIKKIMEEKYRSGYKQKPIQKPWQYDRPDYKDDFSEFDLGFI